MQREYTLWVAVLVTALHVLDEFTFDFKGWAASSLGLNVPWELFHLINAAVLTVGISCSMIGWRLPEVSLMLPATIAVNALFHLGLTVVQFRYSPGAATSALLFLPVAAWVYHAAYRDGVLTKRAVLISAAGGAMIQTYFLALLTAAS